MDFEYSGRLPRMTTHGFGAEGRGKWKQWTGRKKQISGKASKKGKNALYIKGDLGGKQPIGVHLEVDGLSPGPTPQVHEIDEKRGGS